MSDVTPFMTSCTVQFPRESSLCMTFPRSSESENYMLHLWLGSFLFFCKQLFACRRLHELFSGFDYLTHTSLDRSDVIKSGPWCGWVNRIAASTFDTMRGISRLIRFISSASLLKSHAVEVYLLEISEGPSVIRYLSFSHTVLFPLFLICSGSDVVHF